MKTENTCNDFDFDFSDYITRNNRRRSDGVMFTRDSFKSCDGTTVPILYDHDFHTVIGHAVLENREEGVYAYCTFYHSCVMGRVAAKAVFDPNEVRLSFRAYQVDREDDMIISGRIRTVHVTPTVDCFTYEEVE